MADTTNWRTARGMRDILPKDQLRWQAARKEVEDTARVFGFDRIDVPVIEYADLFDRSIGSDTDIISKELFVVSSKDNEGGRPQALRPEFTAGITRAYLQNGMGSLPQPVRLYGLGPVFRYDRPQKGRYREHTQFSAEVLGSRTAAADAWIIYLGWTILKNLGLTDVTVQINSLGSIECQQLLAKKLTAYFKPHSAKLGEVDQRRLVNNPLRLLDSKDPAIAQVAEDAPQSLDCLDKDSKKFFSDVLSYLDEYGVEYNLNPRIVRGLDYYSHTVFEYTLASDDGQQGSLGGGGRYDLVGALGGAPTPSVGMALGMDRIILAQATQKVKIPVNTGYCDTYIIHLSKRGRRKAQEVLETVHKAGLVTLHSADKTSLRGQLKSADKVGAKYAVIIGETEAKNDMCILRDMRSGIQEDVACSDLADILYTRLKNGRGSKKAA